jgi:hypothetical protein
MSPAMAPRALPACVPNGIDLAVTVCVGPATNACSLVLFDRAGFARRRIAAAVPLVGLMLLPGLLSGPQRSCLNQP